jgi:hypothetical protein
MDPALAVCVPAGRRGTFREDEATRVNRFRPARVRQANSAADALPASPRTPDLETFSASKLPPLAIRQPVVERAALESFLPARDLAAVAPTERRVVT